MKNNKGFIGLGLILAIIAVLAVGGGAYYLGTKNSDVSKDDDINQVAPISSGIRTSGAGGEDGKMKTNPDSSITVISPNGGEKYVAGNKMTIKWKTVNVNSTLGVWFHLDTVDGKHLDNGDLVKSWTDVLNTSETTIIIPKGIPTGQYKLAVTIAQELEDVSDNFFVIESQISNLTITQKEAENLVYKTWSDCSQGDCVSVKVSISDGNLVTAIFTEMDASVAFSKREAIAIYQNGVWKLGQVIKTVSCKLGHGHQEFSTALCF